LLSVNHKANTYTKQKRITIVPETEDISGGVSPPGRLPDDFSPASSGNLS